MEICPMYQKQGFTLMELLVVVLIIGILSSVALPRYQLAVRKTKASAALAFSEKLSDAQSLYFLANGAYPPDMESLDITVPVVKPYMFMLGDNGFTVRAHSYNDSNLPAFNVFGAHAGGPYDHLINQRFCVAENDNAVAVCKALGGVKNPSRPNVFDLPIAKK